MSTKIEICVEPDGTFSLEAGEREEAPPEDQAEGGEKQTFKTKEEVLSAASQLLDAASMGPPGDGMATDDAGLTEDPAAAGQEDQAMQDSYRKGVVQ